jgi:ATP adenylyltransferase
MNKQQGTGMEHLWAPWRLSYVSASPPPSAAAGCFICSGLAANEDRQNLIVLRTPLSAALLNRYPYNNGHLLIAPRAHKGQLADLDPEEMLDTLEAVRRLQASLDRLIHPDGYNIGLNLGKIAGAGLPGHLHWHLVPRWNGDTNFMPVLAGTKVIPQALDCLFDLLKEDLDRRVK